MQQTIQGYLFTDDRNAIQHDRLETLMRQTYWAKDRPMEVVEASLQHSLCFSVFAPQGQQVGFARVLTDYATTYYICDVILDEQHRGQGLGTELLKLITTDKRLCGLLGLLLTSNAHRFYEKFGFSLQSEKCMMIPRQEQKEIQA